MGYRLQRLNGTVLYEWDQFDSTDFIWIKLGQLSWVSFICAFKDLEWKTLILIVKISWFPMVRRG